MLCGGGQNDETESARRATWTGLQPAHVAAASAKGEITWTFARETLPGRTARRWWTSRACKPHARRFRAPWTQRAAEAPVGPRFVESSKISNASPPPFSALGSAKGVRRGLQAVHGRLLTTVLSPPVTWTGGSAHRPARRPARMPCRGSRGLAPLALIGRLPPKARFRMRATGCRRDCARRPSSPRFARPGHRAARRTHRATRGAPPVSRAR